MKYSLRAFILFAVITALTGLTGCESSTGPDDPHNGSPDYQIVGTWLGIFDEPVFDLMFIENDAMYAVFNESEFKIISLEKGDQVAGIKGTFTFNSGNELELTLNDIWISYVSNWASEVDETLLPDGVPFTVYVEFSSDGNLMTVGEAGGVNEIEFSRQTVVVPENLAGSWGGHGMVISISTAGEFEVNTPDGTESGTIGAIDDIGGVDYLLIHLTDVPDAAEYGYDVYQLYPYETDNAGTELVIHAGDDLFVLTTLEPVDEGVLTGSWFGLPDQVMQGPADRNTDALYFEFDGSEFLLLSFLESDPSAGHTGTYSFEFQGALQITPVHDWDPGTYNWITVGEHTSTLPLVLSPDGNTLSFIDGQDEVLFEMHRKSRTVPQHLAGTWAYIEDGVQYATFTIDNSGGFVWDQGGEIQSGSLRDIGVTNGEPYLIVNITYCDFDAGGVSDYYIVNRYNVDGNVFSLWHGDEGFSLERQ